MTPLIVRLLLGFYHIKNRQQNKLYNLGLTEAITAQQLLNNQRYADLEQLLQQLDSDSLSLVVDALTLSFKAKALLNYEQQTKQSPASKLLVGTHYLHQAWIARSHRFARDVGQQQFDTFFQFQAVSRDRLTEVASSTSLLGIEATARLIRNAMGYGDVELSNHHYQTVIATHPDHLWAHLHYCEVIQPKWGGSLKHIQTLMNTLPSRRPLIQHVTELKLLLDSFTLSQNYFGGTMRQLEQLARKRLKVIDQTVSQDPPNSIHRYIVYNYLFVLAQELGQAWISIKNCKKMEGYYTLYPFGVVR